MSDASKILENINKLQETLENNYLKTITIMFTDLKDSTKYFEKHGDIKGRLFIERHNNMLFPIIDDHNGDIIKTIGDSIMAKFDSPYLAVRASIKMQKLLDDYNQTASDKIRIRIGIHTGQAIVENNDIFGDAVNVAARIESDTAPCRTTISSVTLEEIKKFQEIKTRPLGKVKFKGKSDEIETFSVLWRTTELENNLESYKKDVISKTQKIKRESVKKEDNTPKPESPKLSETINKNIYLVVGSSILVLTIAILSYFLMKSPSGNELKEQFNPVLTKDRKKIKEYAKSFIDKRIPKSDKWNSSLSGFIKMVYFYFNIDITDTNPKNKNGSWKNTTELIHSFVRDRGKLFKIDTPKAGDFIFFDNTYDKNKNGKFDDMLTTVGLVVDVDKEGTVYFLYKVGNTIRIRNMNLKHPDKETLKVKDKNLLKVLNSRIRRLSKKDKKNNIPDLSSQLFSSFGTLLDIPKKGGDLTKLKDFKLHKHLGNHEREKVVKFAKKFKGKSIPESNLWRNSSAGFIKMIFLKFNVNITKAEATKSENGKWLRVIELMKNFIKENAKLYTDNSYQIGDLIFFDNTYDKNKNARFDDKFTSIGIIIDIDKEDTIHFLINVNGKVRLKYMNLKKTENKIKKGNEEKIINSSMRFFKKEKKYSNELFNTFGSIFK